MHRIATTVEIVRGLLFGERPMSVKVTAKERGDTLTDQISMVRIWVYPVLAFIVAFLPTLMVEVGFSTLFKEERKQPPHRLGFFASGLHRLYIRAGRQKILRAERLALEASVERADRDRALARTKQESEAALAAKDAELRSVKEALSVADARHDEELRQKDAAYREESQRKEESWGARLSNMSGALNQAVLEKDELRDLQKAEVERQIRSRQDAWLERIAQLRRELDEQRDASESERTKLMQEQHEKLMAVTEDCKSQVILARRQSADAELATVEKSAKLSHDLKGGPACAARRPKAQVKQQAHALAGFNAAQIKEDAARDFGKGVPRGNAPYGTPPD